LSSRLQRHGFAITGSAHRLQLAAAIKHQRGERLCTLNATDPFQDHVDAISIQHRPQFQDVRIIRTVVCQGGGNAPGQPLGPDAVFMPTTCGISPTKASRSTGSTLYDSAMVSVGSAACCSGVGAGDMRAITAGTKPTRLSR